MSFGNELVALSELLGGNDRDSDQFCEKNVITPASIAASELSDLPIGQIIPPDPKAIWKDDEIPDEEDIDDCSDTRIRPKYEFLYGQDVMTEDVFLGMGDKDPSIASCDTMIVRIQFPGHTLDDLELDVTSHKLLAESTTMKLSIHLPHTVRQKDGKAKWESCKQTLTIILPIVKELF